MKMIGASTARGWNSCFAYQNELAGLNYFGSPLWSSGSGTYCPLPSFPIAQAARYWWGVQRWKITGGYTVSYGGRPVTVSINSGWLPYGVGNVSGNSGQDGNIYTPARTWLWLPRASSLGGMGGTDRMLAPSFLDRFLPNAGGQEANYPGNLQFTGTGGGPAAYFKSNITGDSVDPGDFMFGILGAMSSFFLPGGTPQSIAQTAALVFDTDPSKVFMSLLATDFVVSTFRFGYYPDPAFSGTFDGWPIDFFYYGPSFDASATITGSIDIVTSTS
jgi:hypothetical protein